MRKDSTSSCPVFIVGCGRSGTTILYDTLCQHPAFAWFSSFSERLPAMPCAAALSRLHNVPWLRRWAGARLPRPVEGYPLWDYCKPVADSPCDPPLTEKDVDERTRFRVSRIVAGHLQHQRKSRFINKSTRNTRRIRFLQTLFPDARFIHIIRDPRATVHSLLNVGFWPELRVWSHGNVTPVEWEADGRDPAVLAARLWVAEVSRALDDSKALPEGQYFELGYEQLMDDPLRMLSEILAFIELPWSSCIEESIAAFRFRSMNSKFRKRLSGERIARIEEEVSPLAWKLGYEPQVRRKSRFRESA